MMFEGVVQVVAPANLWDAEYQVLILSLGNRRSRVYIFLDSCCS